MPFDQPELSYIGRGKWKLTNRPAYRGRDQTLEIPEGFVTDFATSPRIFWAFIPPFGAYEAATVLHDWLCEQLKWCHQYNQRYPRSLTPAVPPVDSVDTDGLFRRVMRESSVPFVTRWVMWAAVRWGAAFSPYRRSGWWRWPEAPLVLLITAVELYVLRTLIRLLGKVL